MHLLPDKRRRLVELTRKFLHEEIDLGNRWEAWADSEERLLHVEQEIVHLLLHFLRDGKIIFMEGQQDEDVAELLSLLEDFHKDLFDLKNASIDKKGLAFDADKRLLHMMEHRLALLTQSVHKEDDEIKSLVEKEFGLSDGKEWDLREKDFTIEYHPRVRVMDIIGEEVGLKGDPEPYLFIFDKGYLVTAVQGEISKKTFNVESATVTYIKSPGYLTRAIKLLLLKGRIDLWVSQQDATHEEKESYLAIRNDGLFDLHEENSCFMVELSEKGYP